MFHDERPSVVYKFRKAEIRGHQVGSKSGVRNRDELKTACQQAMHIEKLGNSLRIAPRQGRFDAATKAIPPHLKVSLADVALDAFYLHQTIGIHARPPLSNNAATSTKSPEKVLTAAIRALGAIQLESSYDCTVETQRLYGFAVRSLNIAIVRAEDLTNDKLLLAVLLLDQFEDMNQISNLKQNMRQAHLLGALSLLQLRGNDSLQSLTQVRLFSQLASTMANFAIYSTMELPVSLMDMMEFASPSNTERDPSMNFLRHKIQFASKYTELLRKIEMLPYEVWEEAMKYDTLFARTCLMSLGWSYDVFETCLPSPVVANGMYHIYGNYMAAMLWNDIRGYRLLTNRLIVDSTNRIVQWEGTISDQVLKSHEMAKTRIRDLQHEILATVPQHLGLVSLNRPNSIQKHHASKPHFLWTSFRSILHNPTSSSKRDQSLPLTRMFGGCLLPFSLYLVYLVDLGDPDSVASVTISMLRTLAEERGVRQAAHFLARIQDDQSE
jgi:hypothetical protein